MREGAYLQKRWEVFRKPPFLKQYSKEAAALDGLGAEERHRLYKISG